MNKKRDLLRKLQGVKIHMDEVWGDKSPIKQVPEGALSLSYRELQELIKSVGYDVVSQYWLAGIEGWEEDSPLFGYQRFRHPDLPGYEVRMWANEEPPLYGGVREFHVVGDKYDYD